MLGSSIATNYSGNVYAASAPGSVSGKGGFILRSRSISSPTILTFASSTSGATAYASAQNALCITEDGQKIIIGGISDNTNIGAVWWLSVNIGTVTQIDDKLVPLDSTLRNFGQSVSCSALGKVMVATGASVSPSGDGFATVYY
jgi:hypothetical protein